jgi:hypothetical protein
VARAAGGPDSAKAAIPIVPNNSPRREVDDDDDVASSCDAFAVTTRRAVVRRTDGVVSRDRVVVRARLVCVRAHVGEVDADNMRVYESEAQ